jgi:hypothetical protein
LLGDEPGRGSRIAECRGLLEITQAGCRSRSRTEEEGGRKIDVSSVPNTRIPVIIVSLPGYVRNLCAHFILAHARGK